jgi:HEPN domain-containing protein
VLAEVPPKTHNLIYLLNKIGIKPEQDLYKFIVKLNTANVATRYPEDLAKIQVAYTKDITSDIINKSKGLLKWLKTQF